MTNKETDIKKEAIKCLEDADNFFVLTSSGGSKWKSKCRLRNMYEMIGVLQTWSKHFIEYTQDEIRDTVKKR